MESSGRPAIATNVASFWRAFESYAHDVMSSNNRSAVVILFCVLLTLTSCTTPAVAQQQRYKRSVDFVDTRQREFVTSLRDYEISIPVKVTSSGEHLSNSVVHHVRSSEKSKIRRRSARDVEDETTHDVHYRVVVNGTELHLQLQANMKLFGPGLVVERRNSAFQNFTEVSRIHNLASSNRCHYYGAVRHLPNSKVALAACQGLHGFIYTGHDEYFIEPVNGHNEFFVDSFDGAVGHPHLIYKRSALPPGHHLLNTPNDPLNDLSSAKRHGTCGVAGESLSVSEAGGRKVDDDRDQMDMYRSADNTARQQRRRRRRVKRSVSVERNVETLVVVDRSMVDYYKNEDIENYVLTIMNMVATMYHDATIGNAINIVLVRIIYLEHDEPNLKITHHADNTLASFCKWQISINPKEESHPNHHDVAVLLTRTNICSRSNEPCSTLGLSQVSGLCQPHRSCNINEDTGLALAFTVTHELGHNFGMQHDTIENSCEPKSGELQHIMSPQMSAEAGPLVWSNCSRKAITLFLDRDWGYCLDDEPSEHQFNFPVLPPGVMYDIDHQCRLQYGPEAEFCEGIDDPCTTVWCRVEKKCLTRLEAAAAGTICRSDESGTQHWCFGGECTEIQDKPQAIDGQWSEWAPWSECSRTCGAGVSHSERHCSNPPPSHGGRYCLGERKRHRVCNADVPCPEGAPSFREHQCAEFNSIPYKGQRYEFEPVNMPSTPCQLHCRPKGRTFSVLLKDVVTDGTPCRRGRRDMCISGRCMKVGCDWTIESDAVEDQCGVCHGDGSTCTIVKQSFDKAVGLGYVEATVIPEGARNIRVEEVAEANNYLAIRNEKGQYYLNGHWYIQWSGDYEVAGTVIRYRRDGNRESLEAPGPIKEPLHVMLLFQSQNPGVRAEYTVPLENVTERRRQEFHWKYSDWTHCTASCGGGTQYSRVVCVEKEAGLVEDIFCNISSKFDDMHKTCNEHQCPARWWTGPWQHCSVTCGQNGIRKRTVLCVRQLGPDEQIALEDRECSDLTKPTDISPCRHKDLCPTELPQWKAGPWSKSICETEPCGMMSRPVICTDALGKCDPALMPQIEKRCSNATCGIWRTADWSMCTRSCNGGFQFRNVTCHGGRACPLDDKPPSEQQCNKFPCPATTIVSTTTTTTTTTATTATNSSSNVTQSPKPQTTSGATTPTTPATTTTENNLHTTLIKTASVRTEPVTNIHPREHQPPNYAMTAVPDRAAGGDVTTTSTTASSSSRPRPMMEYRWMSLFWDECSKRCGGGVKTRRVRCIDMKTRETADDRFCATQQKPSEQDVCNTDRCLDWSTSPWQQCSTTCGEGIQERAVTCSNPGYCDPDQKPLDKRVCDAGPCLQWTVGQWEKCSQTCGGGIQRRQVVCINAATQQQVTGCDVLQQPSAVENCNTSPCSPDTVAAVNDIKPTQCNDVMSAELCRALLRMGRCRLDYIQHKCCHTCARVSAPSAAGTVPTRQRGRSERR